MPKRAKAASKKGNNMGSYMTDSGRIFGQLNKDLDDLTRRIAGENTILIKAPKKKRSKISRWVTGAKNVEND
jgi:hypothetical protein